MALYVSCGREADACWASLNWLDGSDFSHEIYPGIRDTANMSPSSCTFHPRGRTAKGFCTAFRTQ
jgi:hypothetical protein